MTLGPQQSLRGGTYDQLRTAGTPYYLRNNQPYKVIARFRCLNEENGYKDWIEDRKCRICGTEEETIEHMMETCVPTQWDKHRLLSASGKGKKWMELVLESRWASI